jgi:hypothetical protein
LLLSPRCNASKRTVISSIVAERVLDLIALLTIFVVTVYGVLSTAEVLPTDRPILVTAIGLLLLAMAAVAIWVLRSHHVFERVRDWLRPLADSPRALISGGVSSCSRRRSCSGRSRLRSTGPSRGRSTWTSRSAARSTSSLLRTSSPRCPPPPGSIGTFDAAVLWGTHRLGAVGSVALSYVILIRFVLYVPITLVGPGGAGHSLRRLVTATVRYPARSLARVKPGSTALERHGTQMVLIIAGCLAVSALTLLFPVRRRPTTRGRGSSGVARSRTSDLVTEGGPSWKPLPIFFTDPFSLFGQDLAPYLWLWVARAGGLLGCVMAYRMAFRLVGGQVVRRGLAGVSAFAALLSSNKFVRDAALGNSEPMPRRGRALGLRAPPRRPPRPRALPRRGRCAAAPRGVAVPRAVRAVAVVLRAAAAEAARVLRLLRARRAGSCRSGGGRTTRSGPAHGPTRRTPAAPPSPPTLPGSCSSASRRARSRPWSSGR